MSKQIEKEDFDALAYVKTTFSNLSDQNIRSTIDKINSKIMQTKTESKTTIRNHFDKFIQCAVLVDKLRAADLSAAASVAERYAMLVNRYIDGFRRHVENAKIDSEEQMNDIRRNKIRKKYVAVFELNDALNTHLDGGDYKSFVDVYGRAKILAERSNSRYLMELFESSKVLKINFLNRMAEIIESPDSSLAEISDAFKFYFKIDGGDKSFAENTLLVNIKYLLSRILDDIDSDNEGSNNNLTDDFNADSTEKIKNCDLTFLDDLGLYIIKLLKCTDSFFIEKQVIDIFIEKIIYLVHYGTNYKIFLTKIRRIGDELTGMVNEDVRIHFLNGVSMIEDKILCFIWRDAEETVVNLLTNREPPIYRIDSTIIIRDFEYLLRTSVDLRISREKIKRALIVALDTMIDPKRSNVAKDSYPEFVENVYLLRKNFDLVADKCTRYGIYIVIDELKIDNDRILSLAVDKLNFKPKDTYLLVLATKIIFMYPTAYRDVFKKCSSKFGDSKVVKSYIGHLLVYGDSKKLAANLDKEVSANLDKQFGFLREL